MPELKFREIELRADQADGDLIPCVLTTEAPVDRGNFLEVLSCDPKDVDLSRAPLPLIVQHDRTQLNIGVIEQVRAGGGKLRGLARFGSSTQAKQILADVKAGVVRSLSVGYELLNILTETGSTVRFAWRPFECSAVSVPADPGAGFYRSTPTKGNNMTDITVVDDIDQNTSHQSRSQRRNAASSVADERLRVREILAIGQQHNLRVQAERAVEDGTTLDEFREIALRNVRRSGTLRANESPDIGLTEREASQFSFVKAVLAQIDPNYARREAGFEMEASRAFAQKIGKEPQGIFVPGEVLRYQSMGRRDLTVGSPSGGGNLVATELHAESFIALLRKRTHVINLGATTIGGLVGNFTIPSQAGAGTAYWVAENSAPTESMQTFGQVALTPKTVGAFTDYSRRMLLQATPDIESIVRADLAAIIGIEADRVAINGSGTSNEPLGILGTSGIGSVAIGTNGGAITWDHVLQLEEALATASADQGELGYCTNNKVRRKLKGTTKVSGGFADFIWSDTAVGSDGYAKLNGYRAAASNNVPANLTKGTSSGVCSAMIFGNWSDVVIGQWGGLDILVDRTTNGAAGGTRVIAFLDMDIAIRRAASFAAILDATTT
jgi:HK97 family phage major capsid protein